MNIWFKYFSYVVHLPWEHLYQTNNPRLVFQFPNWQDNPEKDKKKILWRNKIIVSNSVEPSIQGILFCMDQNTYLFDFTKAETVNQFKYFNQNLKSQKNKADHLSIVK